jgi:dienelactone hydrolase
LGLLPLIAYGQLRGSETVMLRIDAEPIHAQLFKPQAKGRRPAIVLVPGFDDVSESREGFWARELAKLGVATLVVESFDTPSRMSTAQGVRDAYAAAGYLAAQPYVDPARIGIMGMSRGGSVALRAIDKRARAGHAGFASAIALYPGCVAQYRNPQPGAPIQVLMGARDDYAPVRHCGDYLARIRSAGGTAELRVYPEARHGFDGDTTNERVYFFAHAQNLSDCVLYIEDDGSTTYARTGEPLETPRKAQEVMRRDCMKTGATIAADARAKAQALADVKAFLKKTLLKPRSPT